ncbi:MAG TPA: hypothetical protein VGQ62_12715 [Chloroflexota bacterium]|jgi:hypothetical protein|nr:hypothetical protein [Chloroflexota bacterium]
MRIIAMRQIRAWFVVLAFACALTATMGLSVARAGVAANGNSSARQAGATSDTVSVTTDASSYAPGDSVTATVVNGTTVPIAPLGGIVCQGSPWPFGVQRLDDAGEWQDVAFARTPPCVGIAVALLGAGEAQTRQFAAAPSPGTYRVVYAYSTANGSGQGLVVSDPYDVDDASMGLTDPTGSATAAVPMSSVGYLEGQVAIGPLQPVERVGVPPPTPSPAVCTARGLVIYQVDTGAEAARFPLGPDCSYRVSLPSGSYRVELDRRGIDSSKDLPRVVAITVGQTTRLDISIDTGMR